MFGNSYWKREVSHALQELNQKLSEVEKQQADLKSQNLKLNLQLKNVARKLALKLPMSLESLDKGLMYDLIFSDEIEAWLGMAQDGIILDLRPAEDFRRDAIPEAVQVSVEKLSQKMESLSKHQPLLFVCENGIKSVSACELFAAKGFAFLYVLKGGMAHYQGKTVPQSEPVEAIAQA
jgi:rhodanese-related sulfurtransferase